MLVWKLKPKLSSDVQSLTLVKTHTACQRPWLLRSQRCHRDRHGGMKWEKKENRVQKRKEKKSRQPVDLNTNQSIPNSNWQSSHKVEFKTVLVWGQNFLAIIIHPNFLMYLLALTKLYLYVRCWTIYWYYEASKTVLKTLTHLWRDN